MSISFAAYVAEYLLILFSLITCQLIKLKIHKIIKLVIALVAILINTVPVVSVFSAWKSPHPIIFNVSNLFMNRTKIALLTNSQGNPIENNSEMNNLESFGVFSILVILFLTISSCLSYAMFMCAIGCCQSLRCRTRDKATDQENKDTLDPFCMEEDKAESTKLYLPESLYFTGLLVINFALWLACCCVFWVKVSGKLFYHDIWLVVEGFVFVIYMYSLLCTIVSCFIFSKIAYSVTHRCLKLYDEFKNHERQDDDKDGDGLERLIEKDDAFTNLGQKTLNRFELWFTVHWACYTITSFLSIVLFLEIVKKNIDPGYTNIPDSASEFLNIELTIAGLFTVQHCFLFLYPCFKAAAVTVSREKLIKKVNSHPLKQHPLTLERKQLYIQYLKNKKFGFRISFFCARLRFGFNIAYISIFIGLLGVLQKFSDLI